MATMTNKEPKIYYDYFIKWGRKEWYIIPTLVYYHRRQYYIDESSSLKRGLYFQWLKLTIGIQSETNPYYKK